MRATSSVPQEIQVHALCPPGQDLLLVKVEVGRPHRVHLTLRFMPSGRTWSQDLGLVLPGDEPTELELKGLPAGPFVLLASLRDASLPPFSQAPTVVAAHGTRAAVAEMPYLCS